MKLETFDNMNKEVIINLFGKKLIVQGATTSELNNTPYYEGGSIEAINYDIDYATLDEEQITNGKILHKIETLINEYLN